MMPCLFLYGELRTNHAGAHDNNFTPHGQVTTNKFTLSGDYDVRYFFNQGWGAGDISQGRHGHSDRK
jgi:hypothetical protein